MELRSRAHLDVDAPAGISDHMILILILSHLLLARRGAGGRIVCGDVDPIRLREEKW